MGDAKPTGEERPSPTNPEIKTKPSRPANPVWRMMGLPTFRLRLPSRNWLIFLSITGSFSAAIIYDKREKKRLQRKWCKLVEPLAMEPLDPRSMPRRLRIYLEAPPADGLRVAQDHFKEYVKPILVSSGLDWEFIQGRKEGDVRAELAAKIRKLRGHSDESLESEEPTARIRRQNGVTEFDGPQGDIVIGRHTWKEYVRGLHEGWLGPVTAPAAAELEKDGEEPVPKEPVGINESVEDDLGITIHSSSNDSELSPVASGPITPSEPPAEKSKLVPQLPPFISVSAYESASLPRNLPSSFDPSIPISFPHVLGFTNTPLRLYRFLNRRHLADKIGRETAAIVLSHSRPYHAARFALNSSSQNGSAEPTSIGAQVSEQAMVLIEEEKDWHKASRKRSQDEPERTWLEDITLDSRIAGRMRKAELSKDDEDSAQRIVIAEEDIEGFIKGSLRHLWRSGKTYVGLGSATQVTKPGRELGDESLD